MDRMGREIFLAFYADPADTDDRSSSCLLGNQREVYVWYGGMYK